MSAASSAFSTTLTAAPLICTGRLLDSMPRSGTPIALAFSTRKVATAYRGPCMRVRRTSDNREQDIGFVQTDLDWESLLTFAAGFDCFVSAWYDQSGRQRHATQTDPLLQPQIVRNGKVVMDTTTNQISVRFNGAYLVTAWEPTQTEMQTGAGIMASASIGLDQKSLQSGTAALTSTLPNNIRVTTEYPSPLLPEGHDLYLLEGIQVRPDGQGTEVVFTGTGGELTHLTVENGTAVTAIATGIPPVTTPSGPAVLTVDTLATGKQTTTNQWRRGIKLDGRIFAIPYNSDVILEIKYASGIPAEQRIVRHTLPPEIATTGTQAQGKFWTGVAVSSTVGYCIPATARYVLKIDASAETPTLTAIGTQGNTPLDTPDNKWHDAVFLSGKVWAVPHNAAKMLVINPVGDVVTVTDGPDLGTGNALFSTAVASGDKVVGVPWNAACFLVANTTTSTITLEGTTGLTPLIENSTNKGYGYIEDPLVTVAPPAGVGGTTLQLQVPFVKTRSATSVTMTQQGSAYTSSPTVSWSIGSGIRYGALPSSPKPGVATTGGIAATMAPVDLTNLQLGYKITGVRLTSGGFNLPDNTAQNPTIVISGGKGTPAKAQAVVADGKVILINVVVPGTGYTVAPTIQIVGGGGFGAAVSPVVVITPIVYTINQTTGEITSTGGGIVSITVTSTGFGYKSAPEVRIGVAPSSAISAVTGKGVDAKAVAETKVDGQVTLVTPGNPGTGYPVESPNTTTPFILIDPPQRPDGVQARAYISAVNGTGGITAITVSNPGSGYTAQPNATVRQVPNVSFGASPPTCTFEEDGWLSDDVTIITQGTKYVTRPTVTITGGRGPRDGGLAPLSRAGTITVRLDGTSGVGSTAKSPYWGGGSMTSGYSKFRATFVPTGTPSPPVYAFPYSTHRIVKFVTAGNAFTCEDLKLNNPNSALVADRIWFGTASAQHEAGVAVSAAGSEKFYLLPYNGRKNIVRFTENGGADLLTKVYNGNWNQGILSPANQNIYCVPADTNALLVIDTKQDIKSEMVYFSNVRAAKGTTTGPNGNGKWWGAVLAAGDFPGDGLIFGIPSDVDVVLELNPGVPLRRKTLPAPGVVLPDKRHILFAPSLQPDGSRTLLKYDTLTKLAESFPAPSTANVSYVEGVVIPGGNVIFVPTYNQTDPFLYTGNVGVFNTNTNTFSYSAKQVPIGNAAPFPSRTATALGASKLVSWVPREGTAAMVTYDHGSSDLATMLDTTRGVRAQSRVDVAAAVLVGDPATSQRVLVAQPSPTRAVITASPYRDYGTVAFQFAAAALTRQNVMVLVPGSSSHITLFYPDAPEKPLDVLPVVPETAAQAADTIQFPTRMNPPPDVETEFAALAWYQPKFSGAIYNGIDQKVYCVPRHYWRVLVVDPVNYSISDFGDLSGGSETPWTVQRYWGGCQGADGKLYFTPYDADRILVVDPSVENPASRISYIDLPPGAGAGTAKWRGAALANDGRIFCAPYNSTNVLIIDPVAKTSVVLGGLSWLSTGAGKFCDVVVGADKNMYFMPARSPYIVGIDPAATTTTALSVVPSTPLDTKIGDHASADRWGGACAAPNGRLYTAPSAYSEVLEYDIRTGVLERLGGSRDYFVNGTADGARWQAIIPGRNGNVYAFPSWWNSILLIETEQTRAHLWTRLGDPAWLTTQPMDGPYRLRPFLLSDEETAVFHTSGRSSLVMYNVADITANTAPIVGPGVQEGIAAHFPDADDTVLVANVSNLIIVTPFQGGIAGVKSFTGNADLFLGTSGPDLDIAVGNASVGVRNILNTLLKDGVAGVYGAHATASPGDLNLYVRDVPLGGTTYKWNGQVGNTFAVGVVRGTEEPSFNAPSYRRGFNGLLSELVVFQSDQNGQARALGESSAFYYLQSKLPITQ